MLFGHPRRRVVGGNFKQPLAYRPYKADYPEFQAICPPAILASERSGAGFYKPYTHRQWVAVLSSAIGNGVPTYMSYAFGAMYSNLVGKDYYGNKIPYLF